MKKKVMSVFFQLAWAALLVISLLYPRSGAPVLVGASVWVSCFLAWLLAALSGGSPEIGRAMRSGRHC
nr:DNZ54_00345 family protein [uncultured Citrobacter sp.]